MGLSEERAMFRVDLIIVPDEDDPETALTMVDGTIAGRAYRFLLDTGAATTSVAFDDYTAQFPVTGHKRSSGVFGTSADELITVPRLTAGPIVKRDVQIARLPQDANARASLLGMDVLKDLAWRFDFGRRKAAPIDPAKVGEHSPASDLHLDAKAHPYLNVLLDGVLFDSVWDTGAGVTVIDSRIQAEHPDQFEKVGSSQGTDSSGTSVVTDMWIITDLELGGRRFPPHKVATVDLSHVNAGIEKPMHMILGFTTLVLADWLMDFPGKRWQLGPERLE